MAILSNSISGCCAARNLYNLGGAHGAPTASDQNQFDSWLQNVGKSSVNFCITNSYQKKTREYLKTAGFSEQKHGGLILHSISRQKLYNYLKNKKIEKKEVKKPTFSTRTTANRVYMGIVTLDVVHRLVGNHQPPDLPIRSYMSNADLTRLEKDIQEYFPGVGRIHNFTMGWHNVHSLREFIYRRLYRARRGLTN